jgi:signal transduction histidine kinase/CheY-like chemotaxis protein
MEIEDLSHSITSGNSTHAHHNQNNKQKRKAQDLGLSSSLRHHNQDDSIKYSRAEGLSPDLRSADPSDICPELVVDSLSPASERVLREEIAQLRQFNEDLLRELQFQKQLIAKYEKNTDNPVISMNSEASSGGSSSNNNNTKPSKRHPSILEEPWMAELAAENDSERSHLDWAQSESWSYKYHIPPIPKNDKQRCAAVEALEALYSWDSTTDLFNNLCDIARSVFKVGFVAVSILDKDRVWFKGCSGSYPEFLAMKSAHRCISLCNSVLVKSSALVFHNLAEEPLFDNHPIVDDFKMRFYAGAPLINSQGFAIGTFAITNAAAIETFNTQQLELLQLFANATMKHIELKKKQILVEQGKSQFLAHISHEIRTPLHGLLGLCDLLGESELNLEQREHLQDAYDSAESLLVLVNDILDFSKLEAGKVLIERTDFNLVELFVHSCRSMQILANQNRINLQLFHPFPNDFMVRGDQLRIRQILLNLLSNAVKFSPQNSNIIVTLKYCTNNPANYLNSNASQHSLVENPGTDTASPAASKSDPSEPHDSESSAPPTDFYLLFSVSDSGIGISPDMQGKIFNAFVQEEDNISRNFGGTGLGLSISKQLAILMGGQIWVDSIKGKGSIFKVSACLQHCGTELNDRNGRNFWASIAPQEASLSPRYSSRDTSRSNTPSPAPINISAASSVNNGSSTNNSISSNKGGLSPLIAAIRTKRLLSRSSHSSVSQHHSTYDNNSGINSIPSSPFLPLSLSRVPAGCGVLSSHSPLRINLGRTAVVNAMHKSNSPVAYTASYNDSYATANAGAAMNCGNDSSVSNNSSNHNTSETKLNILLVDDNIINLKLACRMLQSEAHNCVQAELGEKAVTLAQQQPFDLIFLDINLPDMDGYEVAARLRQLEAEGKLAKPAPLNNEPSVSKGRVAIVALTASSLSSDKEKCYASGMDEVIMKPFRRAQLLAVLAQFKQGKLNLA